jgi:hypothetical protein
MNFRNTRTCSGVRSKPPSAGGGIEIERASPGESFVLGSGDLVPTNHKHPSPPKMPANVATARLRDVTGSSGAG